MAGRRMTEPVTIQCPYCGESYATVVDASAGSQHYVEDCAICCRPIEIAIKVDESGQLQHVSTRTDND